MREYLKLNKANCKNCYKCIRSCPVKSISFSGNQAQIVPEACILCGHCFVVCPQNAKEIRNDVDIAKGLISDGNKVICSLAPSFVAGFPGMTKTGMANALKKLGFAAVQETAEGAAAVKKRYDELCMQKDTDVIISSCCHSVNLLIEKYYPDALPYLARVVTPMEANARQIKQKDPAAKVVFIGPCISKKAEAETVSPSVDCVLTFEELKDWFRKEGITPEPAPDPPAAGGKTRLFPTGGGILKCMDCDAPDYTYLTVDGMNACRKALEDLSAGNLHHCFVEMSACVGSCIGGPAVGENRRALITDTAAVYSYAKKQEIGYEPLAETALATEHPFLPLRQEMPGSKAIEEVLRKLGKTKPEDELNCGSCGYDTCREKAVAVLNGRADLNMCMPYLKEKAENFSDQIIQNTPNGILVLNEELMIQQINKAACRIMNLADASTVRNDQVVRLLDPTPFFRVMQTGQNVHDERVYLAEYHRYVEQSIIYDREYHIILVLLRDVTAEVNNEKGKEELSRHTIEITDKVVDKQMRVVQEIASLLGETAAETKIALTKLKESLQDE